MTSSEVNNWKSTLEPVHCTSFIRGSRHSHGSGKFRWVIFVNSCARHIFFFSFFAPIRCTGASSCDTDFSFRLQLTSPPGPLYTKPKYQLCLGDGAVSRGRRNILYCCPALWYVKSFLKNGLLLRNIYLPRVESPPKWTVKLIFDLLGSLYSVWCSENADLIEVSWRTHIYIYIYMIYISKLVDRWFR